MKSLEQYDFFTVSRLQLKKTRQRSCAVHVCSNATPILIPTSWENSHPELSFTIATVCAAMACLPAADVHVLPLGMREV